MHDRAFFDLGHSRATRAAHLADDLLDHQLDIGATALVLHDLDVFEADEGLEDLTRLGQNEGAS